MIMEQLMREKLLTVKKEMEGFMKESVPFWLENGIDKEYGGYLVCFDSKGKLMKELAVLTPEDKMGIFGTSSQWPGKTLWLGRKMQRSSKTGCRFLH